MATAEYSRLGNHLAKRGVLGELVFTSELQAISYHPTELR